jgi:hypothetical protein
MLDVILAFLAAIRVFFRSRADTVWTGNSSACPGFSPTVRYVVTDFSVQSWIPLSDDISEIDHPQKPNIV